MVWYDKVDSRDVGKHQLLCTLGWDEELEELSICMDRSLTKVAPFECSRSCSAAGKLRFFGGCLGSCICCLHISRP